MVHSRARLGWSVAVLLLASIVAAYLTDRSGAAPRWLDRAIAISQPAPGQGHEYVARLGNAALSEHERPLRAKLFELTPGAWSPLSYLEPLLGWTRVYYYFSHLFAVRFPDWRVTGRRELGPPNSVNADIREHCRGRFAVWHGNLLFSTSDNSNPLFSGRRYELRLPLVSKWVERGILVGAWGAGLFLCWALLAALARAWPRTSVGFRQYLASVPITVLCVGATFAVGEAYLRATIPFDKPHVEIEWHADVGFLYRPGSIAKWTNHLDFWAEDYANSLGFIDREPTIPKPPETFRIMLVGDSIIEALQVPIRQKAQVLLPAELEKRFPGRKFDVVALGYSGTGQSNQLQWLEKWVPVLKPDLVVAMFFNNDFRDNSILLTSVAAGMGPNHPWRLFFRRNPDGSFARLDPVSNWGTNLLPITLPYKQAQIERLAVLRKDEQFAQLLAGWEYPDDLEHDKMFYAEKIPPVFEEAVAATAYSFEMLKQMSEEKGFGLVVAANVTDWAVLGTKSGPRGYSGEGQIKKLMRIVESVGLPLIDLWAAFKSYGNIDASYWKHDPHLSPTGHRWTARAIADFLAQHPALLDKAASPAR